MDGFGSLSGVWGMVRGTFKSYRDPQALELLKASSPHGSAAPAMAESAHSLEETLR
jgi:hypothetical protein